MTAASILDIHACSSSLSHVAKKQQQKCLDREQRCADAHILVTASASLPSKFQDFPEPNSFSTIFRVPEILQTQFQDFPKSVGTPIIILTLNSHVVLPLTIIQLEAESIIKRRKEICQEYVTGTVIFHTQNLKHLVVQNKQIYSIEAMSAHAYHCRWYRWSFLFDCGQHCKRQGDAVADVTIVRRTLTSQSHALVQHLPHSDTRRTHHSQRDITDQS